ncbi:kunitz-type serine protease inhibitor bitisilin-3-like isoform X2 [Nymphalis io]|uniref:kunitz-type serine protease inhibitor bitisilin-3-like isoform X2 n=1 Tax=Inachis io TaxID=171585 RepID=UPI002168332E|nr:kunitz-type serine protease inhibitor bitisilin-3-like isoform X2 [Nymphalis io]
MLQWYQIYILSVFLFDIKYVNLQNITPVLPPTTEIIDFTNINPAVACKFQPNGYDCDGSDLYVPKFYFDLKMEDCKTAFVGSCPHNLNVFKTLSDCHQTCRDVGLHRIPKTMSPRIFCRLQYDFGHCNGYYQNHQDRIEQRTAAETRLRRPVSTRASVVQGIEDIGI